jgi:hypothetical protein
MALAQWMEDGEPPFDLGTSTSAGRSRSREPALPVRALTETLGLLYADHFPYRQKATARGVRRSPFHEQLKARGAVFGELAGWERANWFANEGRNGEYQYSAGSGRTGSTTSAEHMARARETSGLYDMSSFGKIRVEGRDALPFLQHLCGATTECPGARSSTPSSSMHARRHRGDVTVTRLSETAYLLVTPAATAGATRLARRHLGDRIRGDHRCDGCRRRALRDGAERAR